MNNENTIDPHSMHAGCPVIAGEKWTATKWIHARPFRWTAPAPPKAPPGCDNKHELCKACDAGPRDIKKAEAEKAERLRGGTAEI